MRNIPVQLLDDMHQSSMTLSRLMKVVCQDGDVFGFTTLDRDETFDDGDGPVDYLAGFGFKATTLRTASDFTVDNAELTGAVAPNEPNHLTEEMIRSGKLDGADCVIYEHNFLAPDHGFSTIEAGKFGRFTLEGSQFVSEFLSLMTLLKQQVMTFYSITCRATFGDEICQFDAESLWLTGTVTGVDSDEPNRIFEDTGRGEAAGFFEPGLLQWTTGSNAERYVEIETSVGSDITIEEPMYYPIQIGDQYRIRRDCAKTKAACLAYDNYLNFDGEPDMPIGDGSALGTPGAY